MRVALAPQSRLASRGAPRAGSSRPGAGRSAGAWSGPGPAARSPGSGTGSPGGSGVARPDSSPHGAAADTRAPRRSTDAPRGGDGVERGSGRTDSGDGGNAGGLRASITSQVEVTQYPICGARAQDGSGMVRRTAPRQASPDGGTPDERSLTVTTAVAAKGDDVESGAATMSSVGGPGWRSRGGLSGE